MRFHSGNTIGQGRQRLDCLIYKVEAPIRRQSAHPGNNMMGRAS